MVNLIEAVNKLLGLITKPKTVIVSRSVAAAVDYGAEDVISDIASAGGASWLFPLDSQSGVIEKCVITCSVTALTPRLTLYLHNDVPACDLDDNDTNTCPILGDKLTFEGKIDCPAMEDLGTGMSNTIASIGTYGNLPLPYYAPNKKLYGVLVTRDAITGEAANMVITIKLQVRQD